MLKNIKNMLLSAAVFFTITMPFRKLFTVLGVTEMRPAGALPPALGLILGIPGALGCAVGNLAADVVSGFDPLMCVIGFPIQFIYGIFPLFIWRILKWQDTGNEITIRLNNVKSVLRYISVTLSNAVLMALMLGSLMQGFGVSRLFSTGTLMLFLNNFVFCMVLGIPIIIFAVMRKLNIRQAGISLNERFVLIFLLLCVISGGLVGAVAYIELSNSAMEPLALWNRVYIYVAADQFVFYFITIAFLWYSEKNITVPIETVAGIAKDYISGGKERTNSEHLASRCADLAANRSETGTLAAAFREMVLNLDAYIDNLTAVTAEKERIGAELEMAAKIQASMLPSAFPAFPDHTEIDIYASMQPAKEVGGDFYDFFLIDDKTLAIVMADVSGKGVPAALFMVDAKTLIKNSAQSGKSPKEVFEAVNNILCENNNADMFVTVFMGYLDITTGKFVFVNAGHNPPLLYSGGSFGWLKTKPDFVLAGMKDMFYRQHEITFHPGDELFLYTDGVTEAENHSLTLFGSERLIEMANNYLGMPIKEFVVSIKNEVDRFTKGAEQADDITMLTLRYKGK